MFPNCPICGSELNGTVEATWSRVPLHETGYNVSDGEPQASEVVAVHCPDCGWEGSGRYYYSGINRSKTW